MSRKTFHVPDHGLWDDVTRSIHPLKKSAKPAKPTPSVKTNLKAQLRQAVLPAISTLRAPLPTQPPPPLFKPTAKPVPPLARFDRKTEQRLTRGKVEIEGRIDLHGENLEMARVKLLQFITSERAKGCRLVLVITGKGASPFAGHTLHGSTHFNSPEREGKLRRAFPMWLQEAQFRDHVTGFQPAHPRHGGGGAFYVKLRRDRRLEL